MSSLIAQQIETFLTPNFLLESKAAQRLYHDFAAKVPIIDYHCHLPPKEIAENRQFENLTKIWLDGDHYKWRAMRTNGINEKYITGDAPDFDKHLKWAETVPYTLRNPLYHWSHLELDRYFGIQELFSPKNAEAVYYQCTEHLQTDDFKVRNLIRRMKVEVICTTDDPIDDLRYHQALAESDFEVKVLPTFRPDKAILIQNDNFVNYIQKLEKASDQTIINYADLIEALRNRADFFHELGGRLSDHGLEQLYAADFTESEVDRIFQRRMNGQDIFKGEALQYQSALLYELGLIYHEKGWTQQFHLGAMRNNNSRMMRELGPDTGFDSIGDYNQAIPLSKYLSRLEKQDQLAKTILYNLNPRDNAMMATMIGNFNDGSIAGKIQYGSAWWFLDQLDGMEEQINVLSNMGLISRFVGMLTDSRSFLSFPRHEYFRRLLCNMFGKDIERGHLPKDFEWIGQVIQNICYYNAKGYFKF
ncbi:MAG: glucuronate isomerase [Bacteroidota bacterium]